MVASWQPPWIGSIRATFSTLCNYSSMKASLSEFSRHLSCYLASHNRPIHEVLFPAKRDIAQDYDGTFRGMTLDPVALEDLLTARERMLSELQKSLNPSKRRFLISVPRNEVDWCQLDIPHLADLPAIRSKLQTSLSWRKLIQESLRL